MPQTAWWADSRAVGLAVEQVEVAKVAEEAVRATEGTEAMVEEMEKAAEATVGMRVVMGGAATETEVLVEEGKVRAVATAVAMAAYAEPRRSRTLPVHKQLLRTISTRSVQLPRRTG